MQKELLEIALNFKGEIKVIQKYIKRQVTIEAVQYTGNNAKEIW